MSVELYLFLLLLSVAVTILLTEVLKRLLNNADVPYRANAVALDSAMISGTLVSIILKNHLGLGLSFSATQVTRLLLVILSTWFAAMWVYDKMVQTKEQYRRYRKIKEDNKYVKELRIQTISKHSSLDESGGGQSGQDDGSDSGCNNRNDSNDGSC